MLLWSEHSKIITMQKVTLCVGDQEASVSSLCCHLTISYIMFMFISISQYIYTT